MDRRLNKRQILTAIIFCIFFTFIVVLSACTQQKINKVENNTLPNTVAENAVVLDKYKDVSNEMKEFAINEFIDNISKISRESGHTQKILDYIYDWGINHNLSTNRDKSGCVYFDVPATPGCEDYPKIIFQSHVDMVHAKVDDSIDMVTQPINIIYDEEKGEIHSKDYKTNIGADDAQGIITMMALSTNKNYSHGPMRMLFTYDEETTFAGAMDLSSEVINSEYLINIDSSIVPNIYVSSCGCYGVDFEKAYSTIPNKFDSCIKIKLSDLLGGHSGVDINKNRMNANIVLIKLLQELKANNIQFSLAEFNGGDIFNKIPNSGTAIISINKENVSNAQNIISKKFDEFKNESSEETNAKINVSISDLNAKCLSEEDTYNLLEFVNLLPNGCLEASKDNSEEPIVSANLAVINLNNNGILKITEHTRSNIDSQKENFEKMFKQISQKFNSNISVFDDIECWQKSDDSSLENLWFNSFKKSCSLEGSSCSIHGSLECSLFLKKNPSLKMIYVGMDVDNEHMVTETLYTKSMAPFFSGIIELLGNANQLNN